MTHLVRGFGNEEMVYYGCVLQSENKCYYYCVLTDDENSNYLTRGFAWLNSVAGVPNIGDEVSLRSPHGRLNEEELNRMTPVGKLRMDASYRLKDRCTLVELSDDEKCLTSFELINSIQKQYLNYKEQHPYGSMKSALEVFEIMKIKPAHVYGSLFSNDDSTQPRESVRWCEIL